MIHSKEVSLKPLIKSAEGIHLTSYFQYRGDVDDFKKQIESSIDIAREHLAHVMPEKELNRFLAPLNHLLTNPKLLKNFTTNMGLFRTKDSFRMISIPIDIDYLCVVATSFHVKPLLRWIQTDKDFLFLGIENDSASLYVGSQKSLRLIDTIQFKDIFKFKNFDKLRKNKLRKVKQDETIEWVNEWLLKITKKNQLPLFISGERKLAKRLITKLRYPGVYKNIVCEPFSKDNPIDSVVEIRNILKNETKSVLRNSLFEFFWAEDLNLGKKNLFQIAKAAVQGKVRKLIVADGIQIFGKLDKSTGVLSINPVHLDHEDDDLLDDIAQSVLSNGGEVIVAPKEQIPKGRPILAILKEDNKNDDEELNKSLIQQLNFI